MRISDGKSFRYDICKEEADFDRIERKGPAYWEPFFDGVNITVTLYLFQGKIVVYPYVFDFPFIFRDGKMIKTRGAACFYAQPASVKYHDVILKAIESGIEFTHSLIDNHYAGFITLQFLVNEHDFYFVEYDIRPGEPEFINILSATDMDITSNLY